MDPRSALREAHLTGWVLAVALAGTFVAHVVKGITGFGSSLLLIPILALLWGPRDAIFVSACLDFVVGVAYVVGVRRLLRPGLIAAVYVPVVAGQWLGTDLLASIPEAPLQRAVGVIFALFALEILVRPVRAGRGELEDLPGRPRGILAGAAAVGLLGGVLAGLTGASGPPIILFMRRWFTERFFRAQLLGIFALGAMSLVSMLWLKGVGDAALLARVGILLPAMALGAFVGSRLAGRIGRVAFSRVVGAAVLVAGLGLVLGAR